MLAMASWRWPAIMASRTRRALSQRRQTKGLRALGEEVRAIEAGDQDGRKFPRLKKSDDATAVLLRVRPNSACSISMQPFTIIRSATNSTMKMPA